MPQWVDSRFRTQLPPHVSALLPLHFEVHAFEDAPRPLAVLSELPHQHWAESGCEREKWQVALTLDAGILVALGSAGRDARVGRVGLRVGDLLGKEARRAVLDTPERVPARGGHGARLEMRQRGRWREEEEEEGEHCSWEGGGALASSGLYSFGSQQKYYVGCHTRFGVRNTGPRRRCVMDRQYYLSLGGEKSSGPGVVVPFRAQCGSRTYSRPPGAESWNPTEDGGRGSGGRVERRPAREITSEDYATGAAEARPVAHPNLVLYV